MTQLIGFNYLVAILGMLGFITAMTASAQNKVLKAGAATANITPGLGEGIVGNFGTPPPAMHVHDELLARCLVLDDGTTKLVFVIADNVGINREVFEAAKEMIGAETGIPAHQVLLAANHTHSAVSAGGRGEKRRGWHAGRPLDEYQSFLARRMADVVRIALNNLEPAQIAWGAGEVPQHVFNRRWIMKEKVVNPYGEMHQVLFNPGHAHPDKVRPAGPVDPEVCFLSVRSAAGRPIALLANYSLHYVGGVPKDHISGDYFAVFADRIQELLSADRQDPPFVGIMSNGTSGDVNTINFAASPEQRAPYEKMKIVANDVAQEVVRVAGTLTYRSWVPLRAAQSELALQVRKPSPALLAQSLKIQQRPAGEKGIHPLDKTYADRIIQIDREWPDTIHVPLQAFGIGELGIAAIPFEVFAASGLELKKRSPFKTTFTIELANGSYGYLPTPDQHKLGGYETWLGTNRVEPEASVKIENEIMELFRKVQ